MDISWTKLAHQDRNKIREYIAQHNPQAAIEVGEKISDMSASLIDQPMKARKGRVIGTRELVIPPHFIVVYRLLGVAPYYP